MTKKTHLKKVAPLILVLGAAGILLMRASAKLATGSEALWTSWEDASVLARSSQATQAGQPPAAFKASDTYREDDFPSIAAGRNGEAWLVWSSYSALRDEIRLRRYADGRWYTFTRVPGVAADVFLPQVAVDAQCRVWVVWAQLADGNYDLYAASLTGAAWSKVERLTSDPQPDVFHRLIVDGQGKLWVVWQGARDGQFDILLMRHDGASWSKEIRVTDHPANDWEPAVAVNSRGRAHVVWDSYRNGNYDVFLREVNAETGELGAEIAVANTPLREARASVVCDKQDRVWTAWDTGGVNWGKDQGYTIRANPQGVVLYDSRQIGVKVFSGAVAKEPVGDVQQSLPESERNYLQSPRLGLDAEGRVWMAFHHRGAVVNENAQGQRQQRSYWAAYATYYQGDAWSPAVALPNSWGRISGVQTLAPASDGRMWLAWNTDNRKAPDTHVPVKNDVYLTLLPTAGAAIEPALRDPRPVTVEARLAHTDEVGDVKAIRAYRAAVGGKQMRVVRGDFHRHTEFSWDGGGFRDSSLLDFYRYMIDAAAMDFGASTDHNAGGDYEYWWWLTQKLTDVHHLPGSYVALYGYERSAVYPNGHRNIIHTVRNIPVVSFFTRTDLAGNRPGVGTGALLDNDTKLLYDEIRKTGGIAISHTSATRMGTDWRDNDPALEPVVEIFQGARTSYECAGAPKSADPEKDRQHTTQAGYQPAGFVWNAWQKGYRLGVITSSDHGSTHISYALVYTDDYSRQGIVEAIRKRRTYGATDNIILEYRADDHFMGEEFTATRPPRLSVKIIGTAEIAQVDVIKNNQFIYTTNPGKRTVEFRYQDTKLDTGVSYYYVRAQQKDGQIAWSSPIWVNYKN
jgi:hypothetical protein